jgi:hypothetical protein
MRDVPGRRLAIGPAGQSRAGSFAQVVATVPVWQAAEAGQWLTLGTFPVHGSWLEITTAPVPGAPGPGHHGAVAASTARARCS